MDALKKIFPLSWKYTKDVANLIIGIIVGTYSSVFVATPVAYEMMTKKANKKN